MNGIIPARAGFTTTGSWPPSPTRDHPRSRGVYSMSTTTIRPVNGSSPLARGLRRGQGRHLAAARIIPARAGFTGRPGRPRPRHRDHPRSRGVYEANAVHHGCVRGSSPLARGLRTMYHKGMEITGIIPARAGFTRHKTWNNFRR